MSALFSNGQLKNRNAVFSLTRPHTFDSCLSSYLRDTDLCQVYEKYTEEMYFSCRLKYYVITPPSTHPCDTYSHHIFYIIRLGPQGGQLLVASTWSGTQVISDTTVYLSSWFLKIFNVGAVVTCSGWYCMNNWYRSVFHLQSKEVNTMANGQLIYNLYVYLFCFFVYVIVGKIIAFFFSKFVLVLLFFQWRKVNALPCQPSHYLLLSDTLYLCIIQR